MDAHTLWRLPRVGAPAVEGGRVVVPVTTYSLDANRGMTRLWMVDPDGHIPPKALTSSLLDASKPAVSPDGRKLAFLRPVGDNKQVHLMPLDGGEPQVVTDLPLGVHGCVWMPDGERLVVVADVPPPDGPTGDGPRVTEDAVFRYWDAWLTDGRVPHLFLVDPTSGETRDLTPDSRRWMRWANTGDPVADVAVSSDRVLFCADVSPPPHRDLRWHLFGVELDSGETVDLTPDISGHAHRPRFLPDGRILYGRQEIPDFYADRIRLVVVEGDGRHRVLTEDWDRSPAQWETDGEKIVFVAEDDARQDLWSLDPDGSEPARVAGGGTFAHPQILSDGRLVAVYSTLSQPPELVRVDPRVTPITEFTAEVMREVELGRVEELRFAGAEGDEIHAWLIHPPRPAGEPPPLVHLIHGGPHAASLDGWHWRWNAHVFAAPGYLVCQVNFHGSTSFGQAFAESIQGAWGEMPAADVEAASDVLIEAGRVDPERMAITGGSYGGYLVSWLVTQTSRYRCAVAHAAVTDLAGMYATDVTMGRRRNYGAELFEDPDRVLRWSPTVNSKEISTPTLVVHGEKDYRVPVGQGLEFYGLLKAKGVPARLVYYPDENHWILTPANSLHWHEEVLGWLQRWLRTR